ncbi:tRNA-splicing endonuclease subunit sen54 N-term-domain-containing protein [Xylariaceae sp. FL0594]|nr:tRNA-splicing endonuclease subunit sen54 N-term-domain-containing protein [Xylariaceae sp. FL0594]
MAFDDEDILPGPSPAGAGNHEAFDAEEGDGDKAQDFRLFTSLITTPGNRSQAAGKAIRRGEKDFESHGTRAQESVLEASRTAMHDVLSYTRQHQPRSVMRGWYFPDRWAGMPLENEQDEAGMGDYPTRNRGSGQGLFARERVVALESDKSTMLSSMGRVVTSAEKSSPGWLKTWLLPEEALFLIERGTLDLWWPARGIEDIFPADDGSGASRSEMEQLEPWELGVPLSLQAAYALFIGRDGERGKISLAKFQVYANLRRTGYKVLRATPLPSLSPPEPTQILWQWLVSIIERVPAPFIPQHNTHPPYGPLVRPGLYRSYVPIFEQLALVQRHKPAPLPISTLLSEAPEAQDPFKIHFHVWKSSTAAFSKARPQAPDFQIAVVDARDSGVPTLEQLDALLLSTPWDPPHQDGQERGGNGGGAGFVYKRLKYGWRKAILAVVDRGLISYMKFGEMAFGKELLYENASVRPKAKRGGRGGGRGRGGGGGGRGRGRGG